MIDLSNFGEESCLMFSNVSYFIVFPLSFFCTYELPFQSFEAFFQPRFTSNNTLSFDDIL